MKLGVSSYSYMKHVQATGCGYEAICDLAKATGFDGIEFINLDSPGLGITEDEAAAAVAIREHCGRIGLEVIAYTVNANFLSEDIEKEMAYLRRCVDIAALMGAPVLRHDACPGPRPIPRYHYTDAIAEIAPYIRELTEYAQSKGVRTCTENHGRYFQAPRRVEALIRAVNHPNYGWLVDVGNFMGVDADIPEAVSIAAPYAFHVHFKDNLLKPGTQPMPAGFHRTLLGNSLRPTVVGHGAVPVAQCYHILKDSGYDGYLSVEFEGWEDTLTAIDTAYACLKALIQD